MEKRESGILVFTKAFPGARSLWAVKIPRVGKMEAFDDGRIDVTLDAIAERTGVPKIDEVAAR